MYLDPSGELRVLGSPELMAEIYRYDCTNGTVPAPAWASTTGLDYGTLCTGYTCEARVGIGTSAPLYPLDVIGATRTGQLIVGDTPSELESNTLLNGGYFDVVDNQYNTSFNLDRKKGLSLFYEMSEGTFPLQIRGFNQTENTFRLHQQGILDINYFGQGDELVFNIYNKTIQSPIAALTTDGIWYCQGVVVKHVPFWPDYVFEDTYKLRSLQDVEIFVSDHGHLPGIPSATEIAEDGLDLSTMVILLTEKVEELTLYAIQQEKEMEALRALLVAKGGEK
jgi:hypothetical protein